MKLIKNKSGDRVAISVDKIVKSSDKIEINNIDRKKELIFQDKQMERIGKQMSKKNYKIEHEEIDEYFYYSTLCYNYY